MTTNTTTNAEETKNDTTNAEQDTRRFTLIIAREDLQAVAKFAPKKGHRRILKGVAFGRDGMTATDGKKLLSVPYMRTAHGAAQEGPAAPCVLDLGELPLASAALKLFDSVLTEGNIATPYPSDALEVSFTAKWEKGAVMREDKPVDGWKADATQKALVRAYIPEDMDRDAINPSAVGVTIIDGRFPDVDAVIPKTDVTEERTFNPSLVSEVMQAVKPIGKDKTPLVRLELREGAEKSPQIFRVPAESGSLRGDAFGIIMPIAEDDEAAKKRQKERAAALEASRRETYKQTVRAALGDFRTVLFGLDWAALASVGEGEASGKAALCDSMRHEAEEAAMRRYDRDAKDGEG